MWQPSNLRRTQRASLRRMGLFACLTTVLLLGFLLGRESRDEQEPDQVYLNSAGPADPTPTADAKHGRPGHRTSLGLVVRPSVTPPARTAEPDPRLTRRPRDWAESHDDDGDDDDTDSRLILNGPERKTTVPSSPSSPLTTLESEVIRLSNAERRRAGCAPLRVDRRLTRSARAHSTEMAARDVFSHTSPNGASPWERMEAAGYRDGGAENIGRGYSTAAEAVRSWMKTRSHRKNLLNCALTATGVGVVSGPGGPWWTQDFGYS